MVLKLLLNTRMIWMRFIKPFNNTTQILIVFDNMVADMLSNKILILVIKIKNSVTKDLIR